MRSLIIVWLSWNVALAQSSLIIGSRPATPGATVSVPFLLTDPSNAVALQFDFQFDSSKVTNALPVNLTIAGASASGSGTALDLAGYSQSLNGLITGTGSTSLKIINTNTGTPSTLTLNPTVNKSSSNTTIGGGGGLGIINVVKDGTFTQTITGTNNYTGNTTVTAGTLSLGAANPSNESSTITIAAGAFLNLTYAGTDTVDKLFIGATQLAVGEYGNSSAVLPVIARSEITGTGTLTVTSGPAGGSYSAWQTANSTAQTMDLDHDNDGVANGVEYFLGGNTNTTGFTPLPGVTNTAGTLSVTWTKAATGYAGTYGPDFVVETSATLTGAWTTELADPTPGFTVTFPSALEVKFTFPAGTKNFARLKVTGP